MIDFPSDARERELRLLIERAKYERWLGQQTADLVEREFDRIVSVLTSPAFRDLTAAQRARTAELFRELDRLVRSGYATVTDLHVKEMRAYAQLEADISRAGVEATLAAGGGTVLVDLTYRLPRAYVEAIAKLPIQGLNIGQWFDAQAQTMSRETRRIIQQGLIEGKAPAEIARRILAPAKAEGPVLSRRAVNEARIVSRTTVNAVQNDATMTSYDQLPSSVSDSYLFVAVLDSRTSIQCAAASGRVFRYDDPRRLVPPLHPNCRSTTMPLIRGIDTPMTVQRGTPSLRNYGAWLSTQTQTVQNDVLGVTRAGFWRDGKMSLADAVTSDNRVLTLPQLRANLGLDAVVHR